MKTVSNLNNLNAVTEKMAREDRLAFESFFIGSLSALVSPEHWDTALKTAEGAMKQFRGTPLVPGAPQ